MLFVILVFLFGVGAVLGIYAAYAYVPGMLEQRRLASRLRDVSTPFDAPIDDGSSLVKRAASGPLPVFDKLVSQTSTGVSLSKLIEQSGLKTTPSAVAALMFMCASLGALLTILFTPYLLLVPIVALAFGLMPLLYVLQRRNSRFKKFEEQFPEALDLMSRALRAGHAFQTAMGMAGDELKEPVGPEFKKTFDQQNFGLPVRDALMQLTERVPILDVRFFATAVLIQRETGGNLSEILDNLAHVVRERFKIRRQVRVHTAHGRFTAFVLLSLPAALAVALMMINPDHMKVLFEERLGQMMLVAVIIMQTIGFIWIRKVIRIEV